MYRNIENIPVDHPYETELEVLGAVHSLDSLRLPFLESAWGQSLAANPPRYELFYWDDLEKFSEKFGADMDPVLHGPYQARTIAIPALMAQEAATDLPQLADDVASHFVAYHVVHDDHEGVTGDVAAPFKTAESDVEEQEVWEKMITEVYGDEQSAVLRQHVARFVANDGSFEASMWDVTEKIGYGYTGLQAWRLLDEDDDLTEAERAPTLLLASDVCSRALKKIVPARDKIAFADKFVTTFDPIFKQIAAARGLDHQAFVMEGAGIVEFKR